MIKVAGYQMTSAAFASRKVYLGAAALPVGNFLSPHRDCFWALLSHHSASDDDGHY